MKKITNSGLFLLTIAIIIPMALFSGGVAGYSLSPSGSQNIIDVSERQVDSEYGSATISSVSSISDGGSVAVEVGVGSEEMNPNLQVRDQDNSILRLRRNVEDRSSQSFDSSVFIPSGQSETTAGTYLISLWSEGEVVAVHPVVVQGYDISASTPESVEQGDTATVTADISERNLPTNSELASVEIVVGNERPIIEQEMTQSGSGEYSINVDTSELNADSYDVYIVVRGSAETELGENELLAITEAPDLSVEDNNESDEPTENDESSENAGDNGSDDTTETGSETGSSESNATDNINTSSTGDDGVSSEDSSSDNDQNTQTDSGTIEPTDNQNTNTSDPNETASQDSTPGFGFTVAIMALIVISLGSRVE